MMQFDDSPVEDPDAIFRDLGDVPMNLCESEGSDEEDSSDDDRRLTLNELFQID